MAKVKIVKRSPLGAHEMPVVSGDGFTCPACKSNLVKKTKTGRKNIDRYDCKDCKDHFMLDKRTNINPTPQWSKR